MATVRICCSGLPSALGLRSVHYVDQGSEGELSLPFGSWNPIWHWLRDGTQWTGNLSVPSNFTMPSSNGGRLIDFGTLPRMVYNRYYIHTWLIP